MDRSTLKAIIKGIFLWSVRNPVNISILVIGVFSLLILGYFFAQAYNISTVTIDEVRLISIIKDLQDCNNNDGDCLTNSALLNEINASLKSIEGALKLEEMTALIGVFVTVSTIIVLFNLKSEKDEIKKEMEKIEKNIEVKHHGMSEEIKAIHREVDKTIEESITKLYESSNGNAAKRSEIIFSIQRAKAAYFIEKAARGNEIDTQKTSYELELKLLTLMTKNNGRVVIDAFLALKSYIPPGDSKYEYLKHIRTAIRLMAKEGYFETPMAVKDAYSKFDAYIAEVGSEEVPES